MKFLSKSSVLCLAALIGCSTVQQNSHHVTNHSDPTRTFASVNDLVSSKAALSNKLDELMNGIFQAYMLGQVHLQEYDQLVAKEESNPMESESYARLLAIRSFVDRLEEEFNQLYKNLVLVTALPIYTTQHKKNAEMALEIMGKYLDGMRQENMDIPQNLKPLILSNLREKQTDLFFDLKKHHKLNQDNEVKDQIHKHMILLRTTRVPFYKDMKKYKIDKKIFEDALTKEKKEKSFAEFEADVHQRSKEIKELLSKVGREIQSEKKWVNITGNSYPQGTWSITYDDGPGRKTTSQIVKNLGERNIKATFFMLAQQVEALPDVAAEIRDAGHEIASHSYTHAQLTKVGPVQLEREITTSKKVIEEKLDVTVKQFRLPYGAGTGNKVIQDKIVANDMKHVFWNVDTLDWSRPNPQEIFDKTIEYMKSQKLTHGIVLFHDIHAKSVTASTMLMDYLKKQNATLCTVQGVLDQMEKGLPSCE